MRHDPTPSPAAAQPASAPRRSPLRRAILSVPAGFALAVLIAWGCLIAARMPLRSHVELLDPARDPTKTVFQSHGRWTRAPFAGSAVIFEDRRPLYAEIRGIQLSPRALHIEVPNMNELPKFVRRTPPSTPALRYFRSVETTWCGFPFAMLRSTTATYDDGGDARQQRGTASPLPATSGFRCPLRAESFNAANGILGPELVITWGAIDRRSIQAHHYHAPPDHLPLTPIWPGLIANTAIYTAIIWALFWFLPALRSRIHRWRNPSAVPCRNCGYDLAGLASDECPECGHAITHFA